MEKQKPTQVETCGYKDKK